MLGRNSNNDVFIIDIYLWCLHSKHLTSTSDVSQNLQRVTVVTDDFITLFYGLVLRRSFIHSPCSQPSAVRHATDLHVTNISSQVRHVSTMKKKLLNSIISSTCPHNMVNFVPLAAEIGWRIWGTPANFNGFLVLLSSMHRRRSTEVNQTLHDVWPSPELVHCIYIFWG